MFSLLLFLGIYCHCWLPICDEAVSYWCLGCTAADGNNLELAGNLLIRGKVEALDMHDKREEINEKETDDSSIYFNDVIDFDRRQTDSQTKSNQ